MFYLLWRTLLRFVIPQAECTFIEAAASRRILMTRAAAGCKDRTGGV
jgi:hypothetical protein